VTLLVACATSDPPDSTTTADNPEPAVHNMLTASERDAGWRLLFDGATVDGWRGYGSEEVPAGWSAKDGMLQLDGGGGDIITSEEFANFELALEWRIGEGGNSGIFYLAELGSDAIFMSAPEMQVLDDAGHPNGQDPLTAAGSNFGLYPAPPGIVRPAGEWNQARIVVEGDRVEHWLNGTRVVEYTLGSAEWADLVKNSKFDDWPEYGTARSGHVGLQDHGDPVWYRNIKIRAIG
jgi:hypothetical protein